MVMREKVSDTTAFAIEIGLIDDDRGRLPGRREAGN